VSQELAKVISLAGLDDEKNEDIGRPVLITPGTYDARMLDWATSYNQYFRRTILLMHFRIVEMGRFYGVVLPAWFSVKPSKSKTTVKAGWRSDFLRMYQACFNIKLDRKDRIPMSRFESVLLKVEVVTIARDTQGQPLAKINQYSRVRCCIETLR
jgi:hypothetical protein